MSLDDHDPERGRRIRELRTREKRTQQAVAHVVGVQVRSVYAWERGGPISRGNAALLAQALHTTVRELAGDDNGGSGLNGSEALAVDQLADMRRELTRLVDGAHALRAHDEATQRRTIELTREIERNRDIVIEQFERLWESIQQLAAVQERLMRRLDALIERQEQQLGQASPRHPASSSDG